MLWIPRRTLLREIIMKVAFLAIWLFIFSVPVYADGGVQMVPDGTYAERPDMANADKMERALDALLAQTNEDAFVIFEETSTKKFVQFAGNDHEQLLLNLPAQTLNATELEKAKTLFKEYAIEFKAIPATRAWPIPTLQKEFDMKLCRDTKKAALIAMRIFKEVYGFSDNFSLGIEEN